MIWNSLQGSSLSALPRLLSVFALTASLVSASVFLFPSLPAAAQVAELVADLRSGEDSGSLSSYPYGFHRLGKRVIFFTDHSQQGDPPVHLFVTEGTPETTVSLVASRGHAIAATGELVYFRASSGPPGLGASQLWRTDGTRAGTFQLPLGPNDRVRSFPQDALLDGFLLLFATDDLLWRTDGTLSGTVPVASIPEISWIGPYDDNEMLLMTEEALWITDGTAAGTRRIAEEPFLSGLPVVSGEKVFYQTQGFGGNFLKFLPSTNASPVNVPLPFKIFSSLHLLAGAPGIVIFSAPIGDLWRTDGTAAGTWPITDLEGLSGPGGFWTRGGTTWFTAETPDFRGKLFRVEDRPETQVEVFPACDGPGCDMDLHDEVLHFGDYFYFEGARPSSGFHQTWIADGSSGEVRSLQGLCQPDCAVALGIPTVDDGRLFFVVSTENNEERSLFVTDGTREGTQRITPPDLRFSDRSRDAAELPGVGWILGLSALGRGTEPWVSSEDPASTRILADILPRASHANLEGMAPYGDGLVAIADFDDSFGPDLVWIPENGPPVALAELDFSGYRDLQTAGGITAVMEDGFVSTRFSVVQAHPPQLVEVATLAGRSSPLVVWEGKVFFSLYDGDDFGVWETDGSASGTFRLFDPDGLGLTSFSRILVPYGGRFFYFLTTDADFGVALWRSDGTPGGEEVLGSIGISGLSGEGFGLTRPAEVFGATYFLICREGHQNVWKYSVDEGTLSDLGSAGECLEGAEPGPLLIVGNQIVLRSGSTSAPAGVWIVDMIDDSISPMTIGQSLLSEDAGAVLWKDGLYFPFNDGASGEELWATDGTTAETRLVRDAVPGAGSSAPRNLTPAGDRLYYTAYDPAHGVELWVTDGTEAGTRLAHDLFPGAQSSFPSRFTATGAKLYFEANDGIRGREPWVIPLVGRRFCRVSDETLCLRGNRFRVEALWQDFQDRRGAGKAVQLTQDTGYFWFFNEQNVEAVLKVLDGRANNDHFWSFYGALSNVEYWLTVTDTESGLTRRYYNPLRNFASVGDSFSFGPQGASLRSSPDLLEASASPLPEVIRSQAAPGTAGTCAPSSERLCVNGGRFAVEVDWEKPNGETGTGKAVDLTDDTGYFWFFRDTNVELILKILDGTANNGNYWVFYGSLSNVDFDVTVTDTMTGEVRTYLNRGREFASVGDTEAFSEP